MVSTFCGYVSAPWQSLTQPNTYNQEAWQAWPSLTQPMTTSRWHFKYKARVSDNPKWSYPHFLDWSLLFRFRVFCMNYISKQLGIYIYIYIFNTHEKPSCGGKNKIDGVKLARKPTTCFVLVWKWWSWETCWWRLVDVTVFVISTIYGQRSSFFPRPLCQCSFLQSPPNCIFVCILWHSYAFLLLLDCIIVLLLGILG